MAKTLFHTKLSVTFLREGDAFIAYAPAIDLSTSGKTFEEAKRRFAEAARLFFEELAERGTTHAALSELGWTFGADKTLTPPSVVSHEVQEIDIPVAV